MTGNRARTKSGMVLTFSVICLSLSLTGLALGSDPGRDECELGITLALLGRPASAESVFVSLLSRSPGDPRALTNLGNLALLRGEADLALAFYDRAQKTDTSDAGIRLNRATAFLVLGEEEAASSEAAEGVRRAGGVRAAAGLLGLRYREASAETPKAEQRTYVSKEEVLNLLKAAIGKVPGDSSRAGAASPDTSSGRPKKRSPVWRSAGARAGEASDAATVVYWKR